MLRMTELVVFILLQEALHAEHKEEKDKGGECPCSAPFVVNLSDPGRYLKVTMQFKLSDASDQAGEETVYLQHFFDGGTWRALALGWRQKESIVWEIRTLCLMRRRLETWGA